MWLGWFRIGLINLNNPFCVLILMSLLDLSSPSSWRKASEQIFFQSKSCRSGLWKDSLSLKMDIHVHPKIIQTDREISKYPDFSIWICTRKYLMLFTDEQISTLLEGLYFQQVDIVQHSPTWTVTPLLRIMHSGYSINFRSFLSLYIFGKFSCK